MDMGNSETSKAPCTYPSDNRQRFRGEPKATTPSKRPPFSRAMDTPVHICSSAVVLARPGYRHLENASRRRRVVANLRRRPLTFLLSSRDVLLLLLLLLLFLLLPLRPSFRLLRRLSRLLLRRSSRPRFRPCLLCSDFERLRCYSIRVPFDDYGVPEDRCRGGSREGCREDEGTTSSSKRLGRLDTARMLGSHPGLIVSR